MKIQIFLALSLALVCSTLVEGSFIRRALNRASDRATESKPELREGGPGTRLYKALMNVNGAEMFANTFYAFGNYINHANTESKEIATGERKLNLERFSDSEKEVIEGKLKEFKENFEAIDEVYNNWLIPSVEKAESLKDVVKIFTDPQFQTPRKAYLKSLGKLALSRVYPNEIMPKGVPALFQVFKAIKEDIKKMTFDKVQSFFSF